MYNSERELRAERLELLTNGTYVPLAGEPLSGAPLGGYFLPTAASPSVRAHPQEFLEQSFSKNNTTKWDPHRLFVMVHGMTKDRLG